MNAVSSTTSAEPAALRAPARSLSDRLLVVLPLLSVYAWLCVVYLVEAWTRVTPWLFGDELELTQLSRAIAATGHAARRGEAHSADSLYTVVTAPFWLIHDVGAAYAGVKDFDVFVMASVVFPTYFLARMVVGRGWALFAAAGAGAIPALAYSSYIVQETLAYPYAALCFLLIAKALVTRRWPWIVLAAVASVGAPLVRGELVVMLFVFFLATALTIWSSPWSVRRRASWTPGDYVGFLTLLAGLVFVASGVASTHYGQWYVTTYLYEHRMLTMALWAAAALAIGIGVLPMLAGLAALVRPRSETPTAEARVVRSVLVAAIVSFGMYTAVKAAYLSTVFATRVEERNLVYVAPLLFVGTAMVLARQRIHPVALAAAAAFTGYLVLDSGYHAVGSPYEMGLQLYSDAVGFGILQAANRYIFLSIDQARWLLAGVFVFSVAALSLFAVPALRRWGVALGGLAAVLGVAAVAWSLTGEIGASAATISISRTAGQTLGRPFSWVDDATDQRPTLYFGAGESDPNPENLLEFWNRSITRISSLDGTVQGPGPAGGPSLARSGLVFWGPTPAQYDYAVEDRPCIDFAGTVRATHAYRAGGMTQHWWLVRLAHPNRLVSLCSGLYADGWSGAGDTQYYRFSGGAGGRLRVVVSRRNWDGANGPSPVHVIVSRLRIDPSGYPAPGAVTEERTTTIDSGQVQTVWVRAPGDRFMVRVIVDEKFVPHDVDPVHYSDTRWLGAQVGYLFVRGGRSSRAGASGRGSRP